MSKETWLASFERAKANGLSEKDAIEEADNVALSLWEYQLMAYEEAQWEKE